MHNKQKKLNITFKIVIHLRQFVAYKVTCEESLFERSHAI
jgi:hypothetical protein